MGDKPMFVFRFQIKDTMVKKKIGAGVYPPDSSFEIIDSITGKLPDYSLLRFTKPH